MTNHTLCIVVICKFSIVHEREVKNNALDCYVLGDRGRKIACNILGAVFCTD